MQGGSKRRNMRKNKRYEKPTKGFLNCSAPTSSWNACLGKSARSVGGITEAAQKQVKRKVGKPLKKQDFTVLKIADLHPFPDNPFHVAEDGQLAELAESIKEFGVVTPIITRPKEDGNGYEVIAGQRRVRASQLAGIETIPAFVLPLDRDRAIITLVDSNIQRENILPSERAFAYKMKLEAMKRQGFRTDLTSSQVGTKLRTDENIAQGFGVGKTTVQRFIRLTELIPPMLQMVDEGRLPLPLRWNCPF